MQIARGSHQTEEIEKNEDVEGDGRLSIPGFKSEDPDDPA